MEHTLIQQVKENLYIKREDLIPYSFGGNKARKGLLFFKEIDKGGYDCVVTYGSSHSNHCRIIANMAAARKMKCYLISPREISDVTYNSKFMKLFDAEMLSVPVEKVHSEIEKKIAQLKRDGFNPYFIPGGGHGNIGTQAYVECYKEIKEYEIENNIKFDYIFFASGTGTTHAGLVCGQLIYKDNRKIVGISIARKNPYGRKIVLDSIREYMPNEEERNIQEKTIFIDDYIGAGYGKDNLKITKTIKDVMINLKKTNIKDKKILFIHTGGTPLFFNDIDVINL